MLTENDTLVSKYLDFEVYANIRGLTMLQRGINVTAVNIHGLQFCVEVKGVTSPKPGTNR
ncbi:hypothetical protein QE439_001487 [Pedobacter agri]|nr:hypothetical protein [Pedobacter agri]